MEQLAFLKENVIKSKQNDKSGKNALKLLKIDKANEFLFEKNLPQFMELLDFLRGDEDVFVITGYALCGKSLLTSAINQIILEKTIFYSFRCSTCSTIDDLLLGFFETFKIYAQKRLVHIPKIDTQNFQERINIYLTKCENPIIICLDGLNEIKDKKNKDEIMGFISQIVSKKNIKLIITTRAFEISDLKNINLKLDTSIIKPLTLDDLKNYCLKNIINPEGIEEFLKLSRGHYFNLILAMNYIQPTKITIKEFVGEVETSKKSIDELVILKNLSLIPKSCENLLWVASLSEFGMPISNLLSIQDVNEEQLVLLLKKGIIEIYNECVFVKDYFKTDILKDIEPLSKIDIIKGIIKFLEAQLPLKPAIRELKLSRLTIRNEIERLKGILNKTQDKKSEKNKSAYMTILGYSKQFKTSWDGFDDIIMPNNEKKEKEKYSGLPTEEKPIPEVSEKKIEEAELDENEQEVFETPEDTPTSLDLAKLLKNKYEYKESIEQYSKALETSVNDGNLKETFEILKDMGECYFKLGNYQSAIENYGKAHEIAKEQNLIEDCYYIMLKIAEIYKASFKKDISAEIYQDIIAQEWLNDKIRLVAELNLFEMNFSNLKPSEILQKYFDLLNRAQNYKEIASKIHFRLGFLYDKASSFENAIKHYKSSIEICDNYGLNENISSCYYNLAEIYYIQRNYEEALSYYIKSFAIDEMTHSTEDLIITAKKIARIYERKKDNLAIEYYEKALDLAKQLNDNYPIASAIIDIGDYYYRQKQDLKALKTYLSAQKTLAAQLTKENEVAIKDRINDLRVRMGKDAVDKIIKEFS